MTSTKQDIWGPAAQELLTSLLLAAAASRRTLREVSRWLDDPGTPDPRRAAGRRRVPGAGLLAARRPARRPRDPGRHLPDRPDRGQVPARPGDHGLGHPAPAAPGCPAFDPARFAATRDALYLLTESRSAAAPLIAGLTDTAHARRAAPRRAGRRAAGPADGRWSWTRPRTSAASPTCPTCTPTSAAAA